MKMFNYQPLEILLVQHSMTKKQLKEELNLSSATVAKFSKNEYVSMEVLVKICAALQVDVGDIMEIVEKDS